MDETTNHSTNQASEPRAKGMTLYRPAIVALLYLLNIALGFTVFVGLVLAYVWRNEPATQEWEKTHYTYLIRTFWIGFLVCGAIFAVWMLMVVGIAFSNIGETGANQPPPAGFFASFFGGMVLWLLAAVWFCIRSVLSLVKAGDCQPMPKPRTWLF